MSRNRRKLAVCAAGVACAGLLIAGRLYRPGPHSAAAAPMNPASDPLIDGAVFPDLAGQSHVDPAPAPEESDAGDMVFANLLTTGGRMRLAIGTDAIRSDDPVLSSVHSGVVSTSPQQHNGPANRAPKHMIGLIRSGGGVSNLLATKTGTAGSKTAVEGSGTSSGAQQITPIPAVNIVPPTLVGEPTPQVPAAGDPPVTTPVDAPVTAVPLPPALPVGVAGLIAAAVVARRWKRQAF